MAGFDDIGAALAKLRKESGVSQEELAAMMGLAGGTSVSAIETGNPRASSIHRFLVALERSPRDLVRAMEELNFSPPPPVEEIREPDDSLEELARRGADVFRELAEEVRRRKGRPTG